MADDKERTRAIDLALSQIEKQFGKGSIMRLGSKEAIVPISVISTGSISCKACFQACSFVTTTANCSRSACVRAWRKLRSIMPRIHPGASCSTATW